MKKAFCICFIVISLFCSCAKQAQKNPPIKTGEAFSCTAEIKYDDREFVCDLVYKNSANAKLNIISPEELGGVSFSLTNSELSAHYGDSSFHVSSKNNAVSTARLIFSALGRAVNSDDVKVDKQNGTSYVEGEVSSHKYRLNFDKNNGLPQSFEVKNLDFYCEFRNFNFL